MSWIGVPLIVTFWRPWLHFLRSCHLEERTPCHARPSQVCAVCVRRIGGASGEQTGKPEHLQKQQRPDAKSVRVSSTSCWLLTAYDFKRLIMMYLMYLFAWIVSVSLLFVGPQDPRSAMASRASRVSMASMASTQGDEVNRETGIDTYRWTCDLRHVRSLHICIHIES